MTFPHAKRVGRAIIVREVVGDVHGRGDVGNEPFSFRNSRWRTWIRARTPDLLYYRLGWVVPKARNCGNHDWYNDGDGLDGCYHCEVTRATPPDVPWYRTGESSSKGSHSRTPSAEVGIPFGRD